MAVPIFYLHFRSGDQIILDLEGIDLPDLTTAREEAAHSARELMSFEVIKGELNLDQSIDIHDSDGQRLGSVTFADALVVRVGPRLIDKRQLSPAGVHT